MDVAIGFDTSCYTTSAAAVDTQGHVIAFQRMLLPVAIGQRGLRQSEAVFAHVRQMPSVVEAMKTSLGGATIRIIAASDKPRDDAASYMPVFTVGVGHARTLSSLLGVGLVLVTHQQGHIAAGQLYNPPMADRFVALHLSGGTTELLLCDQGCITQLGGSLDLHAGQMIDRVGVAMGLPFPAGPALEQLAINNREPTTALIPVSLANADADCHLSGAETRCQQWIKQGSFSKERIAAEVFDVLSRTVARMLAAACQKTGAIQMLVVGGVASSTLLRSLVAQRLVKLGCMAELRFGQPEYSADNAAGVAWLGMQRYLAR